MAVAVSRNNSGESKATATTKQAPLKMLRQSSCLYMSAAEVLDQLFRQRKQQRASGDDDSEPTGDDQRTYVVVDFRATEELESQPVLRYSSVRLPCHVFEEDADEAVAALLRRVSGLLHRLGQKGDDAGKSPSGHRRQPPPFLLFNQAAHLSLSSATSSSSSSSSFSAASPVTPARLSTMAGAGREAPHLVVMARGGKKSSGLNLAEKLVVRVAACLCLCLCLCLFRPVERQSETLASRSALVHWLLCVVFCCCYFLFAFCRFSLVRRVHAGFSSARGLSISGKMRSAPPSLPEIARQSTFLEQSIVVTPSSTLLFCCFVVLSPPPLQRRVQRCLSWRAVH